MCRVFKYSVCVDVRFLRISVRGDVQAVVGTFYYFTKVTEDTSDFNLSLMIETLSSEIEHFTSIILGGTWTELKKHVLLPQRATCEHLLAVIVYCLV